MENNQDAKKDEQQTEQANLNADTVKAWLESSDDGKKFIQSYSDAKVTKALKTYEAETLPKLVDKRIKELYPEETDEQKKLRELQSELGKIKEEARYEKLHSLALTEATKRGLPTNLVPFFVGTDEESTSELVNIFEKEFFGAVGGKVQEQFKTGGRRVPQQTTEPRMAFSEEDVRKMSKEEFLKNQDAIKQSFKKP